MVGFGDRLPETPIKPVVKNDLVPPVPISIAIPDSNVVPRDPPPTELKNAFSESGPTAEPNAPNPSTLTEIVPSPGPFERFGSANTLCENPNKPSTAIPRIIEKSDLFNILASLKIGLYLFTHYEVKNLD